MRAVVLLVASSLLLGGCGGSASTTGARRTTLSGARVATMAENRLEAENPRLARGTMACPSLRLRVGAEVRCRRVVLLDGGRELRMDGTVRVTSLAGQGRLHVRLGDRVRYGVSSTYLADDLRTRLRKLGTRPSRIDCPWLSGPAGTTERCTAIVGTKRLVSSARITGRDDATHTTRYVWEALPSLPPSPQR